MTAESSSAKQTFTSQEALHVLTLTPFYPVAGDDGQGCFVAEPLAWLAKLGVPSTVRVARPFYRGGAGINDSAVPAKSVSYFSLPGGWGLSSSGAFLFARLLPEIRRLHELRPIRVIHAHSALPCGHAASLLSRELKIPYVVTVHGLDAFSTRQVGGYAGEWCARVSRSVYRTAHSVICVSEKVRNQVIEGAGTRVNTTVLYNGVDPQIFSPPDSEPEAPTILSVGNLIPVKGHELLLRAFAAVQDQFPGALLEIIGDGPEQPRLQWLANQQGTAVKVYFRGRQSRRQVADAMRRAAIFALPSRYEGLGCVYLEAMSAGRPAIGCLGQGIDEVIESGVNGCLIKPDALQELSETLTGLLRHPETRRKMGDAARRTILQSYTLEEQAARLIRVYQECQP